MSITNAAPERRVTDEAMFNELFKTYEKIVNAGEKAVVGSTAAFQKLYMEKHNQEPSEEEAAYFKGFVRGMTEAVDQFIEWKRGEKERLKDMYRTLTIPEAAKYLEVSEQTIRNKIKAGKIVTAPRRGRQIEIYKFDIDHYKRTAKMSKEEYNAYMEQARELEKLL